MRQLLATSLTAVCLLSPALAQAFAPGDVLVCPAPSRQAAVRLQLLAQGLEIAEADAVSGVLRVRVPVGSEAGWVQQLAANRDVRYAERNGLGQGGLVPNDTHFVSQWHLQNTGQGSGTPGADIQATAAWDVTTGSTSTVIAVLDTGIDSDHVEFTGRIDPNGYDFVNEDPNPEADHPHGSQVSGVLCANAGNGFGVAGVDWQCRVLPIKVLDQWNGGTVMDLAQGLNYVATQTQVQVVSMSLINYPGSQTLLDALQTASSAGKILVACAGNGGMGNANVSYPGASPLTISVGATTNTDARASFSGTGSALDFVAPGVNIVTVLHDSANDQYSTVSGCSFATPMTAGVIGLLLAQARVLGMPSLPQATVFEVLRAGAEDQVGPASEDTPGRDDFFGHGRINAFASLQALPSFRNCDYGSVGVGLGGPFDVLRVNGAAVNGGSRRIAVPANLPFQVGVDVPPSNPQPSATPPFFVLWARFGDTSNQAPWALPLGIGDLCFDPNTAATFAYVGASAPWTTTLPPFPAPFVASLQGAIFDTPQGHIAVTNLVTWEVQALPPPTILSVNPRAAAVGSTVTVSGTGFLAGLTLRVNGAVVATQSVSASTITFAAPAGVPCNTSLSVTNPDAQVANAPYNVSPVLSAVVPIGGTPAAGGTRLLLAGQNFVPGSTVTIGGNAMSLTSVTSTLIDGTLPPGTVGPASIVITTPFQCTAMGSLTYTP